MIESFKECTIDYIPQEQNYKADLLLKLASTKIVANNRLVIQEETEEPSICEATDLTCAP